MLIFQGLHLSRKTPIWRRSNECPIRDVTNEKSENDQSSICVALTEAYFGLLDEVYPLEVREYPIAKYASYPEDMSAIYKKHEDYPEY